jgi:hypothetical protein
VVGQSEENLVSLQSVCFSFSLIFSNNLLLFFFLNIKHAVLLLTYLLSVLRILLFLDGVEES